MSDVEDEADLLSEDYRKVKDDLLDDDLDEAALLYDSTEEDEDDILNDHLSESEQIYDHETNAEFQKKENLEVPDKIPENSNGDMHLADDLNTETEVHENEHVSEKWGISEEIVQQEDEVVCKKVRITSTSDPLDPTVLVRTESVELNDSVLKADERDEDDESENEDDRRSRFKSERDETKIKTKLTGAEKRDIPDTLEISNEDQKKIEDFNSQERERKMSRMRGRGRGRRRGKFPMMMRPGVPRMMFQQDARMRMQNHPLLMAQNRLQFQHRLQTTRMMQNTQGGIIPPYSQSMILRTPTSAPQPQVSHPYTGLGILGPPPTRAFLQTQVPPHLSSIQTNIPPTNLQTSSLPPPVMSTTPQLPQQSSIPVIATINREPPQPTAANPGNPIPTLNSTTPPNNVGREVVYSQQELNRESPQLSVRIRRSRSASRSRSLSPTPYSNSRRTVMRPRRRRRKRSPTRKRSRRKSRSYSRSRSRSYSPPSRGRSPKRESSHSKPDANVKQKIHINPHFKGPRAIYTASHKTLSVSQTTAPSKTATVPPLFTMPPPNLLSRIPPPPLPNILIPPPKPTTESVPTSLSAPLAFNPKIPPPPIIAPPNPQAQPPMAPPPVNIQPPNPRVPPPSLPRVPQPFPTIPPNFTPNQGPPPTKPLVHIQHPITQGILPSSNGQGILPLPPNARLINPTLG